MTTTEELPLRLKIEEEFLAGKFMCCDDCSTAQPEGVKMFKALPRWQTEREQKFTSLSGKECKIDLRLNVCQRCVDLNNRNLPPKEEAVRVTSKANLLSKVKRTKARKRKNILPEEE